MHDLPDRILIVDTDLADRARATLDLISTVLAGSGHEVAWKRLPESGLPRKTTSEARAQARHIAQAFRETPQALIESWRIARHIEAITKPGDAVLLSDLGGVGGMFALEQSALPPEERRVVLIAGADSTTLEYLSVTGTVTDLPESLNYAVDWELTGYRFAAATLATAKTTVDTLSRVGVEAQLVTSPEPAAPSGPPIGRAAYLPEPVSRLAKTQEMLRSLSGLLDRRPDLDIVVSASDRPDVIFEGSTWDSLTGIRDALGPALRRGRHPHPDFIVLGDPFAVPSPEVRQLRSAGVPLLVAAGSTAAALWPDALQWTTTDDLVDAIVDPVIDVAAIPAVNIRLRPVQLQPERAQRVSVGVPIFHNVTYLDACVESLLAQDSPPAEIFLVDDGSRSSEVEKAIQRWQAAHPGLIHPLRQANRGVCSARNLALEAMTGDSFVLIDADETLAPSFISKCAQALRLDPELWAVATWTEFGGGYEGIEAKPPFDARVGIRENPIVSTCVLVEMAVRDAGIRFASDLSFVYCEDWDVWSQIVAAGGKFGLIPEPLAMHRVHPASGGFQRTAVAQAVGKARATSRLRRG